MQQFHHLGYVVGDPRIEPAAGTGIDRPEELPDEVDVLIVGTGPAGMITAAQLAQFPSVTTRIVDRRPTALEVGQADGIQARSVETFQAFGFAGRIVDEAFDQTEMVFWKPDSDDPARIVRTSRTPDDPHGVSEFPHLLVNQARVLAYFAEWMEHSPTRMTPDYGWEFLGLEVGEGDHPVQVRLVRTAGPDEGAERTIRARYVVGADGARSAVRESIGLKLSGAQANHAWGVMDVLAETDFPDIRLKAAIQSQHAGQILLIPREGGHLFRMYVDLGEVIEGQEKAVRATTIEQVIARAQEIMRPFALDVRHVAWNSVYEVGHRLTPRFDDVPPEERGERTPRVFIAGDACHTHSAKAGQGMNVSMQDGWNLGWRLGHVLDGRASERLLTGYSDERQVIAQDLIDFDRQWSTLMATHPEELSPGELEDFYVRTSEFPAGFRTEYPPSRVVGEATHQELATGFPVGKRFKSARVTRVCDANTVHLGHLARADGRWRLYVFAPSGEDATRRLADFAGWLGGDPRSPLAATPEGEPTDAWFDAKVIYPQTYTEVDLLGAPEVFRPRVGPWRLLDLEKVFAALPDEDIFEQRGISRDGAVVVVRPDQYVAHVLPLTATDELGAFFAGVRGEVPARA
ncbi:MAG: FAD-binding monooxygenase [Microbacteriaceae bacterium]|nr:FAD-binding monooxygenase [Microbacteriaceae bacterium]